MLNIEEHVPLAPFTTFKIGGPARWYVELSKEDELKEAVQYARERHMRVVIFSGGSNVLIPDEGLDAFVIRILPGAHTFYETGIVADTGCNLLELVQAASKRRLGGWEKLAGIPGSIGGAVRGNAGAFGSEIKDFVANVSALNVNTMDSRVFLAQFLSFSYRDSMFKHDPEWVITSVNIQLGPKKPEDSEREIADTIAERERRHLQNIQAAGSYFMNPVAPPQIVAMFEKERGVKSREGRVPAGYLIEKAGLKGAREGGAIASEQHPNYLVNAGGATARDVRTLALRIQREVLSRYGVTLNEEAALYSNADEHMV